MFGGSIGLQGPTPLQKLCSLKKTKSCSLPKKETPHMLQYHSEAGNIFLLRKHKRREAFFSSPLQRSEDERPHLVVAFCWQSPKQPGHLPSKGRGCACFCPVKASLLARFPLPSNTYFTMGTKFQPELGGRGSCVETIETIKIKKLFK